MARRLTQADQRRLSRRAGASDLTRLSTQLSRQVESLASQYQTEFTQYQQQVDQMLAPYQEAVQQYQQTEMPAYEAAVAAYQSKYDAYLSALQSYQPYFVETATRTWSQQFYQGPPTYELVDPGGFTPSVFDPYTGTYVDGGYTPPRYELVWPEPELIFDPIITYKDKTYQQEEFVRMVGESGSVVEEIKDDVFTLSRKNPEPAPTFSESAPTAPAVPEMPAIQQFDGSNFEQQRKSLEQGFQREMAERKGSRLAAMQRRSRTLLSGV